MSMGYEVTGDGEKTLINGRVADPKDFPASVWTRSCTATVVGPRTVAYAAHCSNNGGTISFASGPTQYKATCTHAPQYRGNSTADWALCLTDKVVEGIPYESLNNDGSRVKIDGELLLSGYGCIRPGGGGGNDGTYRIGEAKVSRLPSGTNYDIVTNRGAALCFGDSGGPAFVVMSDGKRYVTSPNSRGDIATTSYLSAWHAAPAQEFVKNWSATNKQEICGFSDKAVGCRNGSNPPPTPPAKFNFMTKVANGSADMNAGYEDKTQNACNAVVHSLKQLE